MFGSNLSLWQKNMDTKLFFTADLHLCEKKAPNTWSFHRDFETPEQMNDTIVAKINREVGAQDTLYVLGDVAASVEAEKWLAQINCQNMILVMGEKDQPMEMHKMLSRFFSTIFYSPTTINIGSTDLDMSFIIGHKPSDVAKELRTQKFEQRFVKDSSLFFGLHGHIHRAKSCGNNRDMLNVGCDLWDYVPLSLDRVMHLHGAITKYWDDEIFN